MKDRPIGEKFLYDGHVLEVKKGDNELCVAEGTGEHCFFEAEGKCNCLVECFRIEGDVVFVDCGTLDDLHHTLPVGCKVEIDGTEYVVETAPYQHSCSGCDLYAGKCRRMDISQGTCFMSLRDDGIGVIYKKVEGGDK